MSRNLVIDALKVVLAFFVVGLHGSFFTDIDPAVGYTLKQGLFRSAVPLFLMISGYYFYRANTFEKELKFIGRLFLLYTVWFVIYIPFFYKKYYVDYLNYDYWNGQKHLWYLMHAVYAFFILALLKRVGTKTQIVVVSVSAILGLLLQYNNVYDFLGVKELRDIAIYRNAIFFCLPFIYIGYLSHKMEFKRPPKIWLLVAVVFVFGESYLNYCFSEKGVFDILFSLYVFCPIVFLWAIHSQKKITVVYLSQISVAVYLIHPYFLREIPFDEYVVGIYHRYTLLTLSAFGLSVLTSLILILLNKKIKILL